MSHKHYSTSTQRFIDQFHGHESLLLAFAGRWQRRLNLPPIEERPDIQTFRDWLAALPGDALEELAGTIQQLDELSGELGQQCLRQVYREEEDYDPDPERLLPGACLSLKAWLERPDLFRLALSLHGSEQENQGAFYPDFDSFVRFHERRVRGELVLRESGRSDTEAIVRHTPAQRDCANCPRTAAHLDLEAAHEEGEEIFDLTRLADPDFAMPVDGPDRAYLTEVHFEARAASELDHDEVSFALRGRDVLATLKSQALRHALDPRGVQRATIKFYFADSRRARPVIITGANKVWFHHASRRSDAFRYLRQWGVMRS